MLAATDISAEARRSVGHTPAESPRGASVRRVVFVTDSLRPGGKEQILVTLADQCRRRGIATAVVCLKDRGDFAAKLDAVGVSVHVLGSSDRWDGAAILRLADLLRALAPDVINIHDRFSIPYVVAARRFTRPIPIVFSCHGLLLSSTRAPWSQVLASEGVQAFTAVAPRVAECYARFLRVRGPFELIHNGIASVAPDSAAGLELRRTLGIDDGAFVFAAVGAVKPEKGYEDLLVACSQLAGTVGDRSFRVLIAGAARSGTYLGELQAELALRKLEGVVTFLGHCDRPEAIYGAADAFVLPSRTEGLPLAMLEAASARLPIVATTVGDIPAVLGEGAGLLTPPAQPEVLAEAMGRLMASTELCQRLGAAAAERVRENYAADGMAAHYVSLFGRVFRAERKDARPSALILGPDVPLTGGMASVVGQLRQSRLGRSYQLSTLNTGKVTPPGRSAFSGVMSQLALFGRLVGKCLRGRARVVHIHTCSGPTFWRDCALALVARLLRSKVVWHIHGGRFVEFAKRTTGFGHLIMAWSFESASAVVTLSNRWRRRLQPLAYRARWRVVHNGVSVPPEARVHADVDGPVLFIGNLGRDKGAADLIEALRLAQQQGCFPRVNFAGGETAPAQREALLARATDAEVDKAIRFMGVVTGPAMQRALASTGCFVLPSYVEALPISMLEAMAWAKPVVATRVGAVPEVITNGAEGFLIDPGDTEGLASALVCLSGDEQLRRRMGQAARRRVCEAFSVDVMAESVRAVYDAALKGRP